MKRLLLCLGFFASINLFAQTNEVNPESGLIKNQYHYTFQLENVNSLVEAKQIGTTVKNIFIQAENNYTAKISFDDGTDYFNISSNRNLTEAELINYFSKDNLTVTSLTIKK